MTEIKPPAKINRIDEIFSAKNSVSNKSTTVNESNKMLNKFFFSFVSIFMPADKIKKATPALMPLNA